MDSQSKIDWSKFPLYPYNCIKHALATFRDQPDKLDQVFTAFSFIVHRMFFVDMEEPDALTYLKESLLFFPYLGQVLQVTEHPDEDMIAPIEFFGKIQAQFLCEVKEWLLRCASLPEIDIEQELYAKMLSRARPQAIQIDRETESNYEQQRKERLTAGCGLWLDLTRSLKALHPIQNNADKEDVVSTIKIYLRLVFNVVSGKTCEEWDNIRAEYIYLSECRHTDLIENSFSPYSFRVRQIVANMNYLGCWHFIELFVLPHILKEQEPGLAMVWTYRWVMLAATHPNVDPSGSIKKVLSESFDLECIEKPPLVEARGVPKDWIVKSIPGYVDFSDCDGTAAHTVTNPWGVPDTLLTCLGTASHTPDGHCADLLTSHLPDINSRWITDDVHEYAETTPEDECLVCQKGFADNICFVPNACAQNHLYHLTCLEERQHSLSDGSRCELLCVYCKALIVDVDAAIDQAWVDYQNVEVMFYTTPQQFEKAERARKELDALLYR